MALIQPPSVTQNGCTVARQDRLIWGSLICSQGVDAFDSMDVSAGSGLSVDVSRGGAWVEGTLIADQGLYYVFNDASVNVVLAAADPTDSRIDLIVAQVNDSEYAGSSDTGQIRAVTGTPGPAPSPPAAPDNSVVLGTATVPAGSTGSGMTVGKAPYREYMSMCPPSALPELGGSADLNDYTATGTFTQSQTADAISGSNYPIRPGDTTPVAGLFEVFSNSSTMIWHRYSPYGQYGTGIHIRSWFGGAWQPWQWIDARTTAWIDAATAGFTGDFASITAGGKVRKLGGAVHIYIVGTLSGSISAGNVTNVDLWNIPAGWRPTNNNGLLGSGPSGGGWQGYASTGNVIRLASTVSAMASGDSISCVGSWVL